MKSYFLLFLPAFLIMSCQKPKDWDCTCKYENLTSSGEKSKTITNKKQSDANEECTNYGKSLIGGNGKYSCKLTAQ